MATWQTLSSRRTFCFDLEARPGPWGGGDFTWRSLLSAAGVWADTGEVVYIGPGFSTKALAKFAANLTDTLVVCHNGPRYDLPFLSGSLIARGLPPLRSVMLSDTYAHLPKRGQAFSASLANMAQRFLEDDSAQKGSMSAVQWERAYAGDAEALEQLRTYNIQDCHTTLALRRKLIELGLLGAPRKWVSA